MFWKVLSVNLTLVLGLAQAATSCSNGECPVEGSTRSSSLLQSRFSIEKKGLALVEEQDADDEKPEEEQANDEEIEAATATG